MTIRPFVRPARAVACLVLLLLVQLGGSLASVQAAEPAYQYTALGDSIATGYSVLPDQGYVSIYRGYLARDTGATVTLQNDGQNGWTSDSLVWAVSASYDPMGWQAHILGSNVVTMNIGGNNFRKARDVYLAKQGGGADNEDGLRQAVTVFKSDFSGIIWSILALRGTSDTIIRTMDLYNPYVATDRTQKTWPSNPGTDFDVFKKYLDEINRFIQDFAAVYGVPCAKVSVAFNGIDGEKDPIAAGLVNSFDMIHPTANGHQAIADLLKNLGYAPLK